MYNKIELLKSQLFSKDWEVAKAASNQLFIEGEFEYLLELLKHKDCSIRNAAALVFRENKYQAALEPLIEAINTNEYNNSIGTLVYALEALNCKSKLSELFRILLTTHKNWEVQSHILSILEEQEFEFTKDELLSIQNMWSDLKDNWNFLNGIDDGNRTKYDIDKDLINDVVDGFADYLNTE